VRAVTLAFVAFVLSACGMAKPLPSVDSYAHQLNDGNVALFWNCSRPEPALVQVSGWANSPFYPQPIRELEFTLYGVNAQGITVSTAQASAQALQIFTNNPVPFIINLDTTGGEVEYHFLYNYYFPGDREAQLAPGDYWRKVANNVCAGLAP
jgi:hypothetical protein